MYHNTGFDIIAFSPIYPYSDSLKLSKCSTYSKDNDDKFIPSINVSPNFKVFDFLKSL